MTNLQKITKLLAGSPLKAQEQDELKVFLSLAVDDELKPLVKVFEKEPEWIEKIYKNYKDKKNATETQDTSRWKQIIKEEEEELKTINEK